MRDVRQAAARGSQTGAATGAAASRARRDEEARVRTARASDAEAIARLIGDYAANGIMLSRTPGEVLLAIDDYVVAVDSHDRVMACGAVREYSPSLAEVAAIAVAREAQGHGLGTRIVRAVETLARRRGIAEVFALTLVPAFFEELGYRAVERSRYPEKIRRDCVSCARRFGCAEICVQRRLGDGALEAAA